METPRPRIVIAEPFRPDVVERLRRFGTVVELPDATPEKLINAVHDADALLVRMRSHVTARVIDAAPKLRVIGRAGSSLDHIDVRAAQRRQITIVHSPAAAVVSTADYAVALILTIARRILWYDRRVRAGQFESARNPVGREIRNLTIGLLGGGPVAEQVARTLAGGFGCRLIAFAPEDVPPLSEPVKIVTFDELLNQSDVLSIHVPTRDRLEGRIGEAELLKMHPTAMIVNTSRGSAIDTAALAEALKTHRLAGAALDVFDSEPLGVEHPLRNAPNCILTPHVAAATQDVADSYYGVADDVIRVLEGKMPQYCAGVVPPATSSA